VNTFVSVAHAGGQGKTTLAQLLYLNAKKLGRSYNIVAADYLDESGHSKIGKLYPDIVLEYGVGANLTAARSENNPNAPVRYWDRMGDVFLQGDTVIDVGANVISNLLDWGSDRHVKKVMERKGSPRVDFFCICKAERHAIDNLANLVTDLLVKNSFRLGKIFVVQNEVGGPFDQSTLREQVDKAAGDYQISYLKLTKGQSEIWPAMEKRGLSIERVLEMEEDEAVEKLNVDLWTAASGLSELQTWFDFNSRTLRDAGIFPIDGAKVTRMAS
jgi:hypothetical protein